MDSDPNSPKAGYVTLWGDMVIRMENEDVEYKSVIYIR